MELSGGSDYKVTAKRFGKGTSNVYVVIAGVHSDEKGGIEIANGLLKEFMLDGQLPDDTSVIILANANKNGDGRYGPDGIESNRRMGQLNAGVVDKAIEDLYSQLASEGIKDENLTTISLHSFNPSIPYNGKEFFGNITAQYASVPSFIDENDKSILKKDAYSYFVDRYPKNAPGFQAKSMGLAQKILNAIPKNEGLYAGYWPAIRGDDRSPAIYTGDLQTWMVGNHSQSRFIEIEQNGAFTSPIVKELSRIIRAGE